MYKYAIIVAGGSGTRMGGDEPKQFRLLQGKPVLWHTIDAFYKAFDEIQVILVLPKDHLKKGNDLATAFHPRRLRITAGGDTRFQSVKNGLQLVDTHSLVFVHDAVRCLVTPELIRRCAVIAMETGNAVPAIPSKDTVRIQTGTTNYVMPRESVQLIQTPQAFHSDLLKKAFEQEFQPSFTDEASVVEKDGNRIHLVMGDPDNIKLTTPIDLIVAESILRGS